MSADSDAVWQIGIDIAEDHRGVGIGKALTSVVAAEVLTQDRVPYYSIVAGNVWSMRTALSAGFFPAWVDIYTTLDATSRISCRPPG